MWTFGFSEALVTPLLSEWFGKRLLYLHGGSQAWENSWDDPKSEHFWSALASGLYIPPHLTKKPSQRSIFDPHFRDKGSRWRGKKMNRREPSQEEAESALNPHLPESTF